MAGVGVVEHRSTAGGGEAGRERLCILVPTWVLGKAIERRIFEKLGAVLGE